MRFISETREMKTSYGIIWKILNDLDLALDMDEWTPETAGFSAERFGISENRFNHYLLMLQNAGYVEGVEVREFIDGSKAIGCQDIEITLEGIQFLLENSALRKVADAAEKLGLVVAEAGVGAAGAAVADFVKRHNA